MKNDEEHESFQKFNRQEVIESSRSRHSRDDLKLKQPNNHSSNITHSQIVKNPIYRSLFALRQRCSNFLLNCIKCGSADNSFVTTVQEVQRKTPAVLKDDLKKILSDKIVKLKIIDTSRLQLDPNVMHPFVKIHIIDKNTGCYVKNIEQTEDPVIYHRQEITYYNKVERKYEATENDMILPFATNCCDFRTLGNSKGVWNQKFYINYPAHLLFNPDTLFLFEILDFNHQNLIYRNAEDQYDKNNFYRVAWSFLRPVGISKTHIGIQKLELYRYKFNNKQADDVFGKNYIPDVYYDFLWNNHEKYEGYLTVQLNYCLPPKYKIIEEDVECPRNLFEEQALDKKYLQKFFSDDIVKEGEESKQKSNEQLLKFYRNRDICEVPKELVYKLQSERLGCYRVKFIGNYLAAACSNKKSTDGSCVMNLRGHRGIIYSMVHTVNEKYLITSGSDHIVRIWQFPEYTGEFIDEDQSQQYIKSQAIHIAAVYSSSVIHYPLQNILYILTCCFDGFVRLWETNLNDGSSVICKQILINDYSRNSSKVYPTASAVSQSNFFIIGDSIGDIRIFDFSKDKFTLRSHIINEELENDSILSIHILNKNHLIVQASDNLIRHFELLGNKLRLSQTYTGATFESEIVNCSISPDNKYLLCPSETGKPYLWDIFTGLQINFDHLNLNVKGKLVTCDWHSKYNLIVVSGFLDYCPIFVYGNILTQSEIKLVAAQTI